MGLVGHGRRLWAEMAMPNRTAKAPAPPPLLRDQLSDKPPGTAAGIFSVVARCAVRWRFRKTMQAVDLEAIRVMIPKSQSRDKADAR